MLPPALRQDLCSIRSGLALMVFVDDLLRIVSRGREWCVQSGPPGGPAALPCETTRPGRFGRDGGVCGGSEEIDDHAQRHLSHGTAADAGGGLRLDAITAGLAAERVGLRTS